MDIKHGLVVAMIMATPLTASAAIISGYGVYTSSSTASNCPSYCTSAGGGDFAYDSDGGEFSTNAHSVETSYANVESEASLSGSTYLPILRARAESNLGKGGGTTAFGVQGFTYTGASSTTIILDFNLHGSVGAGEPGYARNVLRADVAIVFGSSLEWYPHFATLAYEFAGDNLVDNKSVFITSGSDVNAADSITFDLDPGMDFYVIASMGAESKNGFVDGWNTLTMSFDNDTALVAASVSAVPVPAAVWLFGSGLLGLMGISRRSKR
jgi:hypothetical protein